MTDHQGHLERIKNQILRPQPRPNELEPMKVGFWNPFFNHSQGVLTHQSMYQPAFVILTHSKSSINICAMNEGMVKTHPLIPQVRKLRLRGRKEPVHSQG